MQFQILGENVHRNFLNKLTDVLGRMRCYVSRRQSIEDDPRREKKINCHLTARELTKESYYNILHQVPAKFVSLSTPV